MKLPETTTVTEPNLQDRLREHQARFSPLYQGFLSDHGPMATLALHGIGAGPDRAQDYLQAYQQRLSPLTEAPSDYLRHRDEILHDIARSGMDAVLARRLPTLISGWAKDAYHPLIRIAYGYEFGIEQEVAAGLAYLSWCGPDQIVIQLARAATPVAQATDAFQSMRGCATAVTPTRNFNACLVEILDNPHFRSAAVVVPDQQIEFSRQALAVFHATHNFFALHLVTGSHAFRLLDIFTGTDGEAIFAIGLLAGYAALGAPEFSLADLSIFGADFRPDSGLPDTAEDWLALVSDDEHDIKLAYSARSQAEFFADPAYIRVTAHSLSRAR